MSFYDYGWTLKLLRGREKKFPACAIKVNLLLAGLVRQNPLMPSHLLLHLFLHDLFYGGEANERNSLLPSIISALRAQIPLLK
jgi:hypothetical protein